MTPEEYVEKLVAAAYKQEVDQEENIARSLPFFATALAVLATVLGLVREFLPSIEPTPYSVFSYTCLLGLASAVSVVFIFLVKAVRPRPFAYLMTEADLKGYSNELMVYYSRILDDEGGVEAAVIQELRKTMIDQYSKGAMQNRANNTARVKARTYALTALVLALGFAFLLIGAILVSHVAVHRQGLADEQRISESDPRSSKFAPSSRQSDGKSVA